MKWTEARERANDKTWADLELRPTGIVTTKEQYDYVLYYAKHQQIDTRYIKPFNEVAGKYLRLGDWFGGAAFYFYFSDTPQTGDKEEFSYGKFGKIEF